MQHYHMNMDQRHTGTEAVAEVSRRIYQLEVTMFAKNEFAEEDEISLLTGNDVARILKVSRSFAYQLMRQGQIRTVHIGRSMRVRREDLEAFISENIDPR